MGILMWTNSYISGIVMQNTIGVVGGNLEELHSRKRDS